ncbi:unnamed protein product [Phytophthora fragariaefolia]|uniref:Unnamed protein product n=1 Tax=Phytophthora fragariaefolia TaxID=1490495 RepID=A0A9W7CS79_9STRA|nr:unnamed protein product [Phytophthora fragariaefolia]
MRPLQATALVTLACLFVAGYADAAASVATQEANVAIIENAATSRMLASVSALEGVPLPAKDGQLHPYGDKPIEGHETHTKKLQEDGHPGNDDGRDYHRGGDRDHQATVDTERSRRPSFDGRDQRDRDQQRGRLNYDVAEHGRFPKHQSGDRRPGNDDGHHHVNEKVDDFPYKQEHEKKTDPDCDEKKPNLRRSDGGQD